MIFLNIFDELSGDHLVGANMHTIQWLSFWSLAATENYFQKQTTRNDRAFARVQN